MKTLRSTCFFLMIASLSASALAAADPLRTALEDSKASGKGLSFYVGGQVIPGVVVSIDDRYVIAKSQAQGQIVIRLDKIDGVAGFVGQPAATGK
ncbi:MAG TPA: hypothetical protein PLW86_06625 [Rhodocyclaceae bacterium]|nr:hypothetical protein [Rhodocyclaceae bacterium]